MYQSSATGFSALTRVVIAGVALIVVSAAVVGGVLAFSGSDSYRPGAVAAFAPADTHALIAINTDITSRPWLALPRLLSALEVEERARDELDDAFSGEGLDYATEVEPVFRTLRGLAIAFQYDGDFNPATVVIADARRPASVIELIRRIAEVEDSSATPVETRDEGLGIDLTSYANGEQRLVYTQRDGVVYIAQDPDHIVDLLRRLEASGPLSELPQFQKLESELGSDALLLLYGSGSILDHPDFAEQVASATESLDTDLRGVSAMLALTATNEGFAARGLASFEGGLGALAASFSEAADIDLAAGATPGDALFFFASVGLRDVIERALEAPEVDENVLVQSMLDPVEEEAGLSIVRDIVPLFSGTFALAAGESDSAALGGWFTFMTQSPDPDELVERLGQLLQGIDPVCGGCTADAVVERHGEFVRVRWPDAPLVDSTLPETDGYAKTAALLPDEASALLYLNAAEAPIPFSFSGETETNLEAILGAGFAWTATDDTVRFDLIIPIASE